MQLVLASASPSRRRLLRAAGIDPVVVVSGVDEDVIQSADAHTLSAELAVAKARAVSAHHRDALVLGCDSVLDFEGEILGKPVQAEVARARWRAMRGRSAHLLTGHALRLGDREIVRVASTRVDFADVTDDEIDAYVASGEPLHVAGAFTLDGLGSAFIEGIVGDATNVIGLAVPTLRQMVRELGLEWTALWNTPSRLG